MPRAAPHFTYLDLLSADGTTNAAAFEAILASRVAAEINLRLCVAAGLRAPRLSLGEARSWRAAAAATLEPALVDMAERVRVAAHERTELAEWVAAMKRAAVREREAFACAASEHALAAE